MPTDNDTRAPTSATLLAIIEETMSALADAAMEAEAVGRLAAPDDDGPILEAMSTLEDCAGLIEALQLRLHAALRGLS